MLAGARTESIELAELVGLAGRPALDQLACSPCFAGAFGIFFFFLRAPPTQLHEDQAKDEEKSNKECVIKIVFVVIGVGRCTYY